MSKTVYFQYPTYKRNHFQYLPSKGLYKVNKFNNKNTGITILSVSDLGDKSLSVSAVLRQITFDILCLRQITFGICCPRQITFGICCPRQITFGICCRQITYGICCLRKITFGICCLRKITFGICCPRQIAFSISCLKPQLHQACDQVTTYLRPKNGPIVERTYDWWQRSYDWWQRWWVIARGKSVATRS